MDESFIHKVKLTILEHIEDEKFGVGDLASIMDYSKSQLLKKIKASTGRSPNQYIREIRLQEAAKLIRESDYTASEISYRVGFSSPSYFNKCFHDHFDLTPGEYKELKEEEIQKISDQANSSSSQFFKKPRVLFSIIIILVAVWSLTFFINRNSDRKAKLENSIAVLYFDDMSSESDTEWFCEGVTDEIYTRLAKLKNLKVISRTSVKRFKDSDKTIPQIAKELDVSYIVEGSVKKYDDLFRITVKLLNSYDESIWSREYDKKIENISKIQREVSKNVVQELKIFISPEEEKMLNKMPTDNLKAYEWFLKARSFAEKRSREYLQLSYDYYQQAIDLDPNFADAYAELALVYLYNKWSDRKNWEKNKTKSGQLVDRALMIDPYCAKAYAAKGKLHYLDRQLKEAKVNFEKSLELDPNNALVHLDIALYYTFSVLGDLNKGLYHINKAIELDPFSPVVHQRKIYILLGYKKLTEAKELYKENINLFSGNMNINIQNYIMRTEARIAGLEKKDMRERIKFLHQKLLEYPQNSNIYLTLGEAYNEIFNDKTNYIKYTRKAYKKDSTVWENTWWYALALLEGKKFKDAENLIKSENYKQVISDWQRLEFLAWYYYYKEDYKAALAIVNDSLSIGSDYDFLKGKILARTGDAEGVQKIIENRFFRSQYKAQLYALLKERDSMYHYMDKTSYYAFIGQINGSDAVDPYRKEERYKTFLKKNYLPLTHWNE